MVFPAYVYTPIISHTAATFESERAVAVARYPEGEFELVVDHSLLVDKPCGTFVRVCACHQVEHGLVKVQLPAERSDTGFRWHAIPLDSLWTQEQLAEL